MPRSIKTALLPIAAAGMMAFAAVPSQGAQEADLRLLWSNDRDAGHTFAVEVRQGYATLIEVRGAEQIRTEAMRVGPDATAQLQRYVAAALKTAAPPNPDPCPHGPKVAVELENRRGTVCAPSKALTPLWRVTRAVVRRVPNCWAGLGPAAYEFPQLSKCGGHSVRP